MKHALTAIATAAFAVWLAAPASAEGDKAASGRTNSNAALFERLDKNKDGYISREEAKDATELQGRFAELDVDNDGKISQSEWRALDRDRSASGSRGGSTGGMGGSTGPAGSSSGPNPAGEAPGRGISR